MLGSATFTIVMSSSSMKVPRQTAASVHHFGSLEPARLVVVVVTALTSASCRSIAALSFGGGAVHDRLPTRQPRTWLRSGFPIGIDMPSRNPSVDARAEAAGRWQA